MSALSPPIRPIRRDMLVVQTKFVPKFSGRCDQGLFNKELIMSLMCTLKRCDHWPNFQPMVRPFLVSFLLFGEIRSNFGHQNEHQALFLIAGFMGELVKPAKRMSSGHYVH